jgi:CRP-like cAMP-binding protein
LRYPPASIITASGLITAGLAIALQGIIGDVTASIIIDLDRLYKIGDWIRIDDYTEGKVTDIGWRHTEILTLKNERLIVNNGRMLTASVHNLGQAPAWAIDEFLISVGHDIPSHRVQRIVETALQKHKEASKYYAQVLARTLDSGGVNYFVRYGLDNQAQRWQARHSVIEALRTELHAHGLRISEGLGEYGIFRGDQPLVEQEHQDVSLLLSRTELLKELKSDDLQHIASIAQEVVLPAGIQIIHTHDLDKTLYIVGEGTVEVVLPTGDSRLLHSLDYFGEQGFLIGDPRTADIFSKTPVILYKFSKDEFSKILKDKQNILKSMIEVMSYRSRDLEAAIQSSKQKKPQESWEDIVKRTVSEFFKG